MIIGVPNETKDNEYRIAMTPGGVKQLTDAGHSVLVESKSGHGSGFDDDEFKRTGATIVSTAADAWSAELVVKVKEPQHSEYPFLHKDLVLFTYLHLAADQDLTRSMIDSGVTGIAYETVELANGQLPLLTPMSEVAGRMSIQVGSHFLERMNGGRGKLLGGVPGVRAADVIVIGGGVVGTNAAQMALGLGANVVIIDINLDRLRYLSEVLPGRLTTLSANPLTIAEATKRADLLIGAVLVKGAKAPRLVTREMIATMNPGSVVVDVAVDQGGCIETSRLTSHSQPTFEIDGVVHYCVSNMPGAVPRTSTYALSNATLPYVAKLANMGVRKAIRTDTTLAPGVNVFQGEIVYPAVAEAFSLPYTPLMSLL